MRMFKLAHFPGRPGAPRDRDDDGFDLGQPMLPGALSRLRFGSYRVSPDGPPVCVITDTADGTVTVVLAVVGAGGALTDTVTANAQATAFGSMLDALARGNAPGGVAADPAPGDPRPG